MAKTRLTKAVRQAILDKAVPPAFKARYDEFEAEKTRFADALYESFFGEHEVAARELPRNWLMWTDHIDFCTPEGRHHPMYGESFKMSKEHPFPLYARDRDAVDLSDHPSDHWALAALKRLAKIKGKIDNDQEAAYKALRQLVFSYSNIEDLLDAWPEGEQFLPITPPPPMLPAPVGLASKVNKMLGIEPQSAIGKAMAK